MASTARSILRSSSLAALSAVWANTVLAAEPLSVEEIVVTGSRLSIDTAADRGANPVRVVTSEELTRSGATSLNQFFRKEASFSGSNNNESRDEGGGGRATVNLRGIGDEYTLVLVNGRRYSANGVADVGGIPTNAIQRIEVLKSGASAIYGSDAVAGVVNIILKNDIDGIEFSSSYGNTTDHDASETQAGIVYGASTDSTRFTTALSWSTRNDIQKQDRRITASRDFRPYGGPDRRSGSLALPAAIFFEDGTVLSLDPERFGPGDTGSSPDDFVDFDSVSELTRQSTNEIDTLPGDDRLQGWVSLEHDLGGTGATLFAEGIFNRREQDNYLFSPKYLFAPEIPADNFYNPFGEDIVEIDYVFTEPGTQLFSEHKTTDWRIVGGLRDERGDLTYEVAASYFEHRFRFIEHNVASIEGYLDAISRPGPNALNLFGSGANTPEQLEGLFVAPRSTSRTELKSLDAKIATPLFDLPGGRLRVAAGVEYREETSDDDFDDLYNLSLTEYGELLDSRLSREVLGVFAEVMVPLVGQAQAVPGIASLELGAAVRYEDYDDVGTTTNPQVNLRWLPFGEDLVVRAAYGTSFRAPPIEILNAAQQTFQAFSYFDPVQNAGVDPLVTQGGNPSLTPEEADTLNIGLVYRPSFVTGLSLALDYWRIELTNIIVEPDIQALLNGVGPGQVIRSPNGDVEVIATSANAGNQDVAGFDLTASYAHALDAAQLSIDARLSYLDQFDADLLDGLGTRKLAGTYSSFRADLFGLPRLRGALNPVLSFGPYTLSYELTYVGDYDDVLDLDTPPRSVGSYVTHDIQFGYARDRGPGWLDGIEATAGIANFTDTDVRFIGASFDGYDRSLADYRGRFYYVRLSKKF